MCDVQPKLIALLDHELSSDEAAAVEHHIEGCKECRGRLAAYQRVSNTFGVYCDALVAAKMGRHRPRWVSLLASSVVAAVMTFLAFTRARIEPAPVLIPRIATASVTPPAPPEVESAARKTTHRRHPVAPDQVRAAKWQPMETAVQIAIPADAMFPPGAMPRGLNFIAELSIAPDGSVKQVRLRE